MNTRLRSQIFILVSFQLLATLASDFRVTVGISQLNGQVGTGFDPNRIVPAAGDTITFSWLIPSYINNPPTGSYSVTQGSADAPCQPLAGGFDSGPKTTGPEAAGQAPTMVFQVKDSKPLYFFSSVEDQCKKGMVLGVNTPPSGDGSVESYIMAAGGNPSADANSTVTNTTTTNTTSVSSVSNSTVNNNATRSSSSAINNTTSARPQNSSALPITRPSFAIIICIIALFFSFS